jgi:hypothetical protein
MEIIFEMVFEWDIPELTILKFGILKWIFLTSYLAFFDSSYRFKRNNDITPHEGVFPPLTKRELSPTFPGLVRSFTSSTSRRNTRSLHLFQLLTTIGAILQIVIFTPDSGQATPRMREL